MKITTESFIQRSDKIHNGKYDYSLSVYINNRSKIKIICPKHGDFLQTASSHLRGWGCRKCGKNTAGEKLKYSKEDFIKKSKILYGKNKYNYEKVEYVNNATKVLITCYKHGDFFIRPREHLLGRECVYCSDKRRITTKIFIKRAEKLHNNKYDYSLIEYKNYYTKIKIICPDHGIFEQTPSNHLHKDLYGCSKCFGKISKKQLILCDDIKLSFKKHNILTEQTIKANNRKYCVDILFPDENIIIEYYGDYWHCNPKKFESDYLHPHKKITAKEIWEYDKIREKTLESLNYKMLIVWEMDYKHNKNIILNNINKLLNEQQNAIIKK